MHIMQRKRLGAVRLFTFDPNPGMKFAAPMDRVINPTVLGVLYLTALPFREVIFASRSA